MEKYCRKIFFEVRHSLKKERKDKNSKDHDSIPCPLGVAAVAQGGLRGSAAEGWPLPLVPMGRTQSGLPLPVAAAAS